MFACGSVAKNSCTRCECVPLQRSYHTPWRLMSPCFYHRNSTVIITSQEEKRLTISFRSRSSLSRSGFSCRGYRWLEVFVGKSLSPIHFGTMFLQKKFFPVRQKGLNKEKLAICKRIFGNTPTCGHYNCRLSCRFVLSCLMIVFTA